MKHRGPLLALSLCLLCLTTTTRASDGVTTASVLAMMARVPAAEKPGTPTYRWDKVGDAREIAEAIAALRPSEEDAADLVLYDVYEGGNRKRAAGDHDKNGVPHSFGPWQISDRRLPPEKAMDPRVAAPTWAILAERSRELCKALPEDERLAAVASGNCDHGRALARRRAALRRTILAD